jgi:hypothetical protein
MNAEIVPIFVCECCQEIAPASHRFRDRETDEVVCDDCRKNLRAAGAVLAMPHAAPCDGFPSSPILIRGCYKDTDAPDNY